MKWHNQILAEAVYKTLLDANYELKVVFAWALNAKTHCKSVRFSPNQLVFGVNLNFPSVIDNEPASMEVSSDIRHRNMNALHSAR